MDITLMKLSYYCDRIFTFLINDITSIETNPIASWTIAVRDVT